MNENENGTIKAAVPIVCPHCDKTLAIELSIGADLLTPEATEEIMEKMEKKYDITQTITTE